MTRNPCTPPRNQAQNLPLLTSLRQQQSQPCPEEGRSLTVQTRHSSHQDSYEPGSSVVSQRKQPVVTSKPGWCSHMHPHQSLLTRVSKAPRGAHCLLSSWQKGGSRRLGAEEAVPKFPEGGASSPLSQPAACQGTPLTHPQIPSLDFTESSPKAKVSDPHAK